MVEITDTYAILRNITPELENLLDYDLYIIIEHQLKIELGREMRLIRWDFITPNIHL